MAARLRAAWGPEFNDYELYDPDGISGYSIVSSPSPPGGNYAFKGLNVTAGATALRGPVTKLFSAQPYTWFVLEDFRADGTFGDGDRFGIWQLWNFTPSDSDGNALMGVGQDDGKYKVGLYRWYQGSLTQNALSSNSYDDEEWISIRVQYDGSRCKVWIDGVLEIDYATPLRPTNGRVQFFRRTGDMATVTKFWSGFACVTSSSASDRPGTDLGRHRLTPNFNAVEASDFGDKVDCPDSALGDWNNWDDWAGGGQNNGDTDYNCDGAIAGSELSNLSTATVSDDVLGVIVHHMRKANAADKVMNNFALLRYNPTTIEVELDTIGTAYFPNSAVFVDPPDGRPWTQTKIDGLMAGVRSGVGNGASLLVTAVGVEVFTIDSDPPAPQDRRRVLNQVN